SAFSEDETAIAIHLHKWAQILFTRKTHKLFVVEVVVKAVANCKFYFGRLAGGDHAVTISDRCSHGLFRYYVLPCLGNSDSKVGVQRRRGDYIHDVYVRIVGDSFQIVIAVD